VKNFFLLRFSLLNWLGWFFLGNAFLFSVIGLQYISWASPENYHIFTPIYAVLAWLFLGVTVPGHFALLALLPLLPILLLTFVVPKRFIIIPLIIILACLISALAAWILIVDTIVFSQYHFHLNGVIFEMFFSDASREIFNFTQREWFTAAIAFLLLLTIEFGYGIWLWRKQSAFSDERLKRIGHTGTRIGVSLAICLFLSYLLFLLSVTQAGYSGISQQPQAFPLYNIFLSRLLPMEDSLNALETAGKAQFGQPEQVKKTLRYPLQPLLCEAPEKKPNIVMIVIDSWRFDMLNAQVTPYITEFARKSTRFMQHYSGGNATQPGIFSLFYGLPGTYWTAMLEQKKGPVLIRELLNQGYQTGIFGSARLSVPAFDSTVFRDIPDLALNTPAYTAAQRDRHITSEFKNFVKQVKNGQVKNKPFFSFLFYDAAHSYCDPLTSNQPFLPVVTECNRAFINPGAEVIPYLNRYKNALYFLDQQIKNVLLTLEKNKLLTNTIVILTSDHGEEFHDKNRGYMGHASNFTDYQVKVPLLVYWPQQAPRVVQKQTSHYDIAPTLLTRALGCTNPASDYTTGQLLDSDAPAPDILQITSYVNFGIRQPDRITTIFRTGNFKIDDLNGKPVPNAVLDKSAVKQTFEMMNRFYQ
jgi:uncharacterized protein